ncbi:MAG: GNAT family N-acetyltransferase [Phycisphaerales bacterium]|nr:GNAT family N-acetyltransferase [Phycisphaerales bacterium]
MAMVAAEISIRPGTPRDLAAVHALFTAALEFDRFGPELLAEKLFANPRPAEQSYALYLAEAGGQLLGALQGVSRPALRRGWLGLFAVAAAHRGRGVATKLFARVRSDWSAAGIASAEALAQPGNYFTPGLDPRYTAALGWLERQGFRKFGDCVNLCADLRGAPFETAGDETRLAQQGFVVRRATAEDGPLLDTFFAAQFGAEWRLETELALRRAPPALHLALRDNTVIAFSAHSGQNREWGFFGPMGTTPAARGTGLGRLLLKRCLNDLRAAGHITAVIPWVGPITFYSRAVPCRVERVFWRYRLDLASPEVER